MQEKTNSNRKLLEVVIIIQFELRLLYFSCGSFLHENPEVAKKLDRAFQLAVTFLWSATR